MSQTQVSGPLLLQDPAYDYPVVERGEGISVYDGAGKRYIDGTAGAGNVILGHGRRRIARIMARQAETLAFVFTSHFTNPVAAELAGRLVEKAPGRLNHVYFVSGGSEGVETSLKLARLYHLRRGRAQKHQVIARWSSYHGATLGALATTGTGTRQAFSPWLPGFEHIDPCLPRACPFDGCGETCTLACASELERAIVRAGPENVAAFVAEPVSMAGGCPGVPPADYFPRIREICDRHDVLWIADEVVTGFGRTGRFFAVEHWDAVPDIVAFGKGISSGYVPMGGALFTDEIRQVLEDRKDPFPHVFTYVNNPLAARVGLTVLDLMEEESIVERSAAMGEYLLERVRSLRSHAMVGDVRGIGMLVGFELVRSRKPYTYFPPNLKVHERLHRRLIRRGLSISAAGGPGDGSPGDSVRIFPPLVTTGEEIDEIVEILDEALTAVRRQIERQ